MGQINIDMVAFDVHVQPVTVTAFAHDGVCPFRQSDDETENR